MKKYIAAIGLIAATIQGLAQDVNKLIVQSDVERIIKTLSADDMQGRATFTPGIEKAARFIENEYRQIGLKPLGSNKDYRQNFTMLRTTPVSAKVDINGTEILPDSMAISASGSFNWADLNNVQIVKIGAGKNFIAEYQNYINSDKKTLVLVDPGFGTNFKRLVARSKRGGTAFKSAANTEKAVVFVIGTFTDVKSLSVAYEAKSQELPLFNVAGIIPGKTKPDEFVVFSGHYDHLGIIAPMQGDSIANGADDDASGTTAVISLAKYYKKLNNNARTLVFVAFTAEEIGEYGSQYFATQIEPAKTIAMFNIEMIGKASKFGENSAFITGYERSDFGKILQSNLQGTVFKFYPDPYPQQDLFYRSDNASLARVGVPAHTISTDQIDTDKLYHSVKDEFSSLDVNNITATIRAIALSSHTIVSGKETPTRVPKLER